MFESFVLVFDEDRHTEEYHGNREITALFLFNILASDTAAPQMKENIV
jgi:hypothetical protein